MAMLDIETIRTKLTQDGITEEQLAANDNEYLWYCAEHGHLSELKELLKYRLVRINSGIYYNKALYLAAINDHSDIVRELLEHREVREQVGIHSNRIFREAVRRGAGKAAMALLKDPTVREKADLGRNAGLSWACTNGDYELATTLVKLPNVNRDICGDKNKPFRWSVRSNHGKITKLLLEDSRVYDHAGASGNYALAWAARKGYTDTVLDLLDIPDVREKLWDNNCRSLRWASGYGHPLIAFYIARVQFRGLASIPQDLKSDPLLIGSIKEGARIFRENQTKARMLASVLTGDLRDTCLAKFDQRIQREYLDAKEYLCEAIYKNDTTNIAKLLKLKHVQSLLSDDSNWAFEKAILCKNALAAYMIARVMWPSPSDIPEHIKLDPIRMKLIRIGARIHNQRIYMMNHLPNLRINSICSHYYNRTSSNLDDAENIDQKPRTIVCARDEMVCAEYEFDLTKGAEQDSVTTENIAKRKTSIPLKELKCV